MWTDPEVRRFLWDGVVIPREQAAQVVEASIESFERCGYGFWAVTLDGEVIGFCGLREIDEGPEVEILYGLLPAHWGRGHATAAARAVLDYGIHTIGLQRIAGRTDAPNAASARVLERLGMRYEGRAMVNGLDTLLYAIGGNKPATGGV
jgi:ribosomal-protein-alanine N-acetyltransferase